MNSNEDMFFGAHPKLFEFARELRKNQTAAEKLIWKKLSKNQIAGFRFRSQHPIRYFIADFYCHSAKLIIEIDGGIHRLPHQFEYDEARDYELNEHGISVMRFTNKQVFENPDEIVKKIEKTLRLISSANP